MKKFLALLLVVAMAAMMFACGNNNEVTTEDTVTTNNTNATNATSATDATGATSATDATTTEPTKTDTTTTEGSKATDAPVVTDPVTTAPVVTPSGKYAVEPYSHITFQNGNIVDLKDVVEFEVKTANGATAATVENTEVTFGGKTKTVSALRIKNLGTWVKATLVEVNNADELNMLVSKNGGWTVEAFYLDNSTTNAVRGIVCVTESVGGDGKRSGWGLAEDASGKPYFITGHVAENAYSSAYASAAASTTELVHVVGIYNGETKKVEIYVNGVLNASADAAGAFTAADKTEGNEKFNMGNVFYIGNDPTGATTKPNGDFPANDLTIVDVKLYDKALSADEVKAIYDAVVADFS